MATKESALAYRHQWLREVNGRRWVPDFESREDFEYGQAHVRARLRKAIAFLESLDDGSVVTVVDIMKAGGGM